MAGGFGYVLMAMLVERTRPAFALRSDMALVERHLEALGTWSLTDGRIPIWLWWNYSASQGKNVPGYVEASQAALEHLAPSHEFVMHKVNESNVRDFLPDWPTEMSKVYDQAVSDVVRAGLLGKYGGVYLDSDMLLAAPLSEITNHLDTHDMVAYQVAGQDCTQGTFSSNFMASRPGSSFHVKWYEEIKHTLKNRCAPTAKEQEDQNACCYANEDGTPLADCHVSWGGLGERIGHKKLADLLKQNSTSYKVFCYKNDQHESFAPCIDCFWTSIPEGRGLLAQKSCRMNTEDNSSMVCEDGPKTNFFNRKAYHLFSSIASQAVKMKSYDELKNGPWVFSHLLKRILEKKLE